MKILAVSDVVNKFLYSEQIKKLAADVDVIVSCGDLPSYYLDFLVTTLGKPLLYVCGNHDRYDLTKKSQITLSDVRSFRSSEYNIDSECFFGGRNLHEHAENIDNVIFYGLEGSIRYNRGDHQYTDRQMKRIIWKKSPGLFVNRLREGRYLDILVTHAPPFGIHDEKDRAHRGFKSFVEFMKKFRPKYLLHGHIHLYDRNTPRITQFLETKVINCYDYQILNLEL